MFNRLSFLSYAIATAITPGPNTIMSMSNAGRVGFHKSFPFNLGIGAGFSTVILIIGALYLLWLAWKAVRSSSVIEEIHSHSGFFSGFLLQFVNPKIYIYCIISMEAYIPPFCQGRWGAWTFFALLLVYCTVSLFLS